MLSDMLDRHKRVITYLIHSMIICASGCNKDSIDGGRTSVAMLTDENVAGWGNPDVFEKTDDFNFIEFYDYLRRH